MSAIAKCTRTNETYCFVMFAQRRMYHSAIEMYLRGIGNVLKCVERFFEFIVIVLRERFHPRLYFLYGSQYLDEITNSLTASPYLL